MRSVYGSTSATAAILICAASVIVFTVLAVALAEFEYRRVEGEALLSLQEIAMVNPEYSFGRVVGLYIGGSGFDNTHLAELKKFPSIVALELDFTSVTDDGLGGIEVLPNLRTLWIGKEAISDQGLASLSQLSNIEWLQVTTEGLSSDDSLRQLAMLQKMQFLTLMGRKIDPNVIQYLHQELPRCQISIELLSEVPAIGQ